MSSINIRRAVDNIRSGTTIYTPVVELIVNAIQAVREVSPTGGTIEIDILRSIQQEMLDTVSAVNGFVVRDDGIGFNKTHRDSFDTLYTAHKLEEGGKGFGRFTCLKYFDKLHIESIFRDGDAYKRRSFIMGTKHDIIVDEFVEDSDRSVTGSVVTLSGIRNVKFPDKNIDVIARVLVEKLLPYFIDDNSICPRIVVNDSASGKPVVLNDYLGQANSQIIELPVSDHDLKLPSNDGEKAFIVRVFKFYAPRISKSKISLVAHRREVTETTIQTYIPEFSDEFYDKAREGDDAADRNYVLKSYVFGKYLDDNVSVERGAFEFQRDGDLVFGLSQSQIEADAAKITQETIGDEISARRERKHLRIQNYVDTAAPWHRQLSSQVDFASLPMNPSPQEIEVYLQTAKFQIEIQARAEVQKILADDNVNSLPDRVAEVVNNISQASKNDLIHYVSLRKCVLDLFEKSLELDEEGNYKSEGDVHDIIMPRHKDSDELNYEQHNLWILDERLNFADYLVSDKSLDGKPSDRLDIGIFGKRIAFRGDNEASNPITIFEFKKPDRHDFANRSSDDDPVEQIIRYVNDIRDGKYKNIRGRDILVNKSTPFYGYVVCDLRPKIKKWLTDVKSFTETADAEGYFWRHGNINLYIEVLSWDKVRKDAEMRNRIFFHKLGIT